MVDNAMALIDAYLKKRCEELSGEHVCNLELLYPSTALQSRLPSAPDLAEALHNTAEELLSHQLDFELIDEVTLLEQDPAEFAVLRPFFMVAHVSVIESSAADWLERYASAGGTVIVSGVIPRILPERDSGKTQMWEYAGSCFCSDFCSRIVSPGLTGEGREDILLRRVRKDGQIRTFLFNRGDRIFKGELAGNLLVIAPGEAGFAEDLLQKKQLPQLHIPSWKLKFSLNSVPLNYWECSAVSAFDLLTKNQTGSVPVPESGKYKAVFTVKHSLEKVFFITEEESLKRVEFELNGTPLKDFSRAEFRDCRELKSEITSLLKPGRNILICTGELMENSPYLQGCFKVEFPYGNLGYPVLSEAPEFFELTEPKDYRMLGYGTFSGLAEYSGKTSVSQDGIYCLKLDLRKESVRILIDGQDRGTLIAPPYQMEVKLCSGEHNIHLEVCNAPGNRDTAAGLSAGLQS